ncbi:hypothetical protein M0R19_08675 [Candidatus Pacearchaeota archaeon]|nr:hypothetical protein [bacterium]MCK9597232.1 hypothetical protein [Candidatus Pacearchaeota archaeon]
MMNDDVEMNESQQVVEVPYCFLPRFIMDEIAKEIESKRKIKQDTKELEVLLNTWILSTNYPINDSIN